LTASFFGVVSMNTMWFAYYATSKWGRKPLCGMKWAKSSFWIMEVAVDSSKQTVKYS